MQQTLLALCAMMIATLFVMNMQQSVVRSRIGMLADEMELMANGVGLRALDRIAQTDFDQITTEIPAAQLSGDPNAAGTGEAVLTLKAGDHVIPFDVQVDQVQFVSGANAALVSGSATDYKRVRLRIEPAVGSEQFRPVFYLSRVISKS